MTAIIVDVSPDERAKQLAEVNRVCNRILAATFNGRALTPTLAAEAEGVIRHTLDEMVKKGSYVLPVGLALDRVEVNAQGMLQIFFKRRLVIDVAP